MSIQGIDVSEFQGNINWEAVKHAGIQFAMVRAGYGASNIDQQFRKNANECNRVGIPLGIYWFSYAYTALMAEQEAESCLETIEDFNVSYPVCFNFEYDSIRYANQRGISMSKRLASELATAFCSRVEKSGYFAMYYSNPNYLSRVFAPSLRQSYALWFAQYANTPSADDIAVWQYTSNGTVDGISGKVNRNIAQYDIADVIQKAGLNRQSTVKPCSPKPLLPKLPAPSIPMPVVPYKIKPGDTLCTIANRFGTTVSQLQKLNGIANPNLLYTGTTIHIQGSAT